MADDEGTVSRDRAWKASTDTGRYDRARVARLQPIVEAVNQLGLSLDRLRKLRGILNALEIQIEDAGDSPEVNRHLLETLRIALRHQVNEQQAQPAFAAIDTFSQLEAERWVQIRAGHTPILELTVEEQLDDLIQKGSELLDKSRTADACDQWLMAWEKLKELIRPELKTIEAFELAYPDLAMSIFNWCSDMEMELGNAGLRNPRYLDHRLRFVREALAVFPDEDADHQISFRRAEGEALWELGRHAEAEAVFAAMIERYPDEGWGYIGWSDIYWLDDESSKEYSKAEAILKRALARTSVQDRSDVLERLHDVYVEWEKPKERADIAAQLGYMQRPSKSPVRVVPPPPVLVPPKMISPPKMTSPRKRGRNETCWCGSGKKYKNCHLRQDSQ